jgi:hypothetical protein
MKYQIQILDRSTNQKKWVSVQGCNLPTPYEYDTREEADRMLRLCYGGVLCSDEMRVVEKS